MTNEEAIKAMTKYMPKDNDSVSLVLREAMNMGIKSLEQEPCDCISREFIEIVVEYPPADLCTYPEYKGKPYFSIKYRENGNGYVGFGTYKIEMLSQWIKEYFISDNQPKTGNWITWKEAGNDIPSETRFECSICHDAAQTLCNGLDLLSPFCPNCGAKMLPTDL